jgi:hypothetical protein
VLNDLMEWVGFAALVAFAWFVWPPAALLVLGLVLVVVANLRAAKRRTAQHSRPDLMTRAAQAILAFRGVARDRA